MCAQKCDTKMYLKEMGGKKWKDVDWIYLVQDRENWRDVVDTVMNIPFQ